MFLCMRVQGQRIDFESGGGVLEWGAMPVCGIHPVYKNIVF